MSYRRSKKINILDGLKIILNEEDIDDKNYITFFIEEAGEDLKCKYNIKDMDIFLNILCVILSGSATKDVIDLIFKEIDDPEIKNLFVSQLLTESSNNLNSEKQKPVISASEFSI